MTICSMETAHKFLVYKNAMNTNYKLNNFITAAHFARLVLDLESTGVITIYFLIFNLFNRYFKINQKLLYNLKSTFKDFLKREQMLLS